MNGSKLLSSVVLLYIDDRLPSEFSSPSPFSCLVWKSQIAHRVSYSRQLCGQFTTSEKHCDFTCLACFA